MINLKCDYGTIAHKKILSNLSKYNGEVNLGYGLDEHSKNAIKYIKKELKRDDVDVHFLVGGTQTNKTIIAHILNNYEAVIACDTGHICVHETGAIEAGGHKIIIVDNKNGKLTSADIIKVLKEHIDEHMVKPRLVFISQCSELGTIYSKKEIEDIYKTCKENDLYLFIDGARLGTALMSADSDMEMSDIPSMCDVFYIGGTKNGAMLGEAVVIVNDKLKDYFRYSIKQNGAMYSKGFVAGIQFETFFEDGLYYECAKNSNECAKELYEGLLKLGVKFTAIPQTNMIFPIFPNDVIEKLSTIALFEIWDKGEEESVIRFVTSFDTNKKDIKTFLNKLSKLLGE